MIISWPVARQQFFWNSAFIVFIISGILLPVRNTLVSFANRVENNTLETEAMSLIYNKNNRGPRIEPWGTAHVMYFALDSITS